MADDSLPRHQLEDETELNQTELQTHLESTVFDHEDSDKTAIDEREETQTELQTRIKQMQTGEDETIVFDERDITEFMDEPPRDLETQPPPADQIEYDRPAGDDSTVYDETVVTHAEKGATPGEDTGISASTQLEDTALVTGPASPGDQTDISLPPHRAERIDQGETTAPGDTAAESTNLTQPAPPADSDPTAADDDMSLLLVERDQTSFTSPTSITDPQRPQDKFDALRGTETVNDDISLADTTSRQSDGAARTKSSDTATTGIAERTKTAPGSAVPHPDATGTYTHAPDNYDRTLMRLPNDDASRLFAGMKSESDVVMTPDYAKQVFRSKSSAKRAQNYKVYGGIGIAVLLLVGVYAILEYQSELEVIDTSLRPLKRDPMPGIVRPPAEEQAGALAGGQIDERTIQLIQNAETDPEPIPDSGIIAETDGQAETVPEAGAPVEESPSVDTADSEIAVAQAANEPIEQPRPEVDGGKSAAGSTQAAADPGSGAETSNLQIQTGSRIQRKQLLLREAYEAYRAGNDTLALERYNQVLALDSKNRHALLGRAAIKVQSGETAAAVSDYRALLLANPKDSLALASLLAVANFSPREAETQLKLMIRDEPDSPYLNFALANAYGAQNRWQEAQGHYFRALQHNPDDPNYAYNLAVSLEHISQPKVAISYYRRALENYNNGLATFNREVVDRRLEILEKQ